jgi:hypothetical protein
LHTRHATELDPDDDSDGVADITTGGTVGAIDTVAAMHGTNPSAEAAPSRIFDRRGCGTDGTFDMAAALDCLDLLSNDPMAAAIVIAASMGYAVIAPDGIGLGDDGGNPIPYLVGHAYAAATFGMHAAVRELALAGDLVPGLTITNALIPAGYSEGGYAALALHKLSQQSAYSGVAPWVPLSLPSGGPSDLVLQIQDAIQPSYPIPAYVCFAATSYDVFYSTSAIASTYAATVHGWFDGTLGTWDINALAIALSGSNVASLLTVSGNTAQNICDEDDGGGSHSFSFVHGMVVGGCTAVIVVGIVAVTVAAATAMPLVAIMHKQTDRRTDRHAHAHTRTHTHTHTHRLTW